MLLVRQHRAMPFSHLVLLFGVTSEKFSLAQLKYSKPRNRLAVFFFEALIVLSDVVSRNLRREPFS